MVLSRRTAWWSRVPWLVLTVLVACSAEAENGGNGNGEEPETAAARKRMELPAFQGEVEDGLFVEPELGLTMAVPEAFVARRTLPGDVELPDHVLVLLDPDAPDATLNLVVGERDGRSLDQLMVDRIEELRRSCPGFRLLSDRIHFTPGGRAGKVLDFQWLAQGEILRQRQLLFVNRDWSFTVTATWSRDAGPESEGDRLAAALASFEFGDD